MNRKEKRKFEKILKKRLGDRHNIAIPDNLKPNDKIILTKEIMLFEFNGKFIGKIQPNELQRS